MPSGKDGFLATNSLLATAVLLVMGYGSAMGQPTPLPDELDVLLGWDRGFDAGLAKLRSECSAIWSRPTTVLLHGYWGQPAAIDFESKFTEASIGHLQVADYRHFAHGRHNWIGQRPADCAIISLETPQDCPVAEETLSLIPTDVPRVRLSMRGDEPTGALEAIVYSLCLAQIAGEARQIDPGRPNVSEFGRTLYHLNVYRNGRGRPSSPPTLRRVAIERKAGVSVGQLGRIGTLDAWHQAYKTFVDRLGARELTGIVLDFDGTLIGCDERDAPIAEEVSAQLIRLLDLGLVVGVATGRGDSVHAALRSAIPDKFSNSVLIGYHNGTIIAPLGEAAPSDEIDRPSAELEDLFSRLQAKEFLSLSARMRLGGGQITVFPLPGVSHEYLWNVLRGAMEKDLPSGINVWRSSHSIDITPASVSKKLVVARLRGIAPSMKAGEILCVGDMGRWPGNDYDLLREPLSLSVDEVSPDPETCWRISPEGVRGVKATLWYLSRIELREGKVVYCCP